MGTTETGEAAAAGVFATASGGHGRETRSGVCARRADGPGALPGPKPKSTAGGSAPAAAAILRSVRVKMRPESVKAVGGVGSPFEGADAAGSVIPAESAHCKVLDVEGACWATLVAEVAAFAEPVPPSVCTAKTTRKQCRRR